MKPIPALTLALIALAMLGGCAAVKTQALAPDAASTEGVVYYLPKRLVKFEFSRAPAPVKADITKATAKFDTAKEAVEAAETERELAEQILKKLTAGTAAHTAAQADLDKKTAIKALAEAESNKAGVALAEAVAKNASAAGAGSTLVDSLSFTLLPPVADTAHRYALSEHHLVTRSDKLDLKTNAAGLLSNASGKAEDKLGDILVALTQSVTAQRIRTAGSQPMWALHDLKGVESAKEVVQCGSGLTRAADTQPAAFRFELVFDPTRNIGVANPAQPAKPDKQPDAGASGAPKTTEFNPWEYLASALCARGADYGFVWGSIGPSLARGSVPAADPELKGWPGIFYRRTLPYQLAIFAADRQTAQVSFTPLKFLSFEVPNESPAELLAYRAGAFTATDLVAEFQDGMLTSHSINRPSDALAVVKVPYDIVKALVTVPAEILQLRVNVSTQEAALIEARTNLLKKQAALEAEQDKARDKEK